MALTVWSVSAGVPEFRSASIRAGWRAGRCSLISPESTETARRGTDPDSMPSEEGPRLPLVLNIQVKDIWTERYRYAARIRSQHNIGDGGALGNGTANMERLRDSLVSRAANINSGGITTGTSMPWWAHWGRVTFRGAPSAT